MAYGNLAYKYDNLAQIKEEDDLARDKKRKESRKLKIKEQRKLNFFIITGIILLSMAAYFMISKNVQMHETSDKIKQLQSELSMLESNTSQKMFELEQSVDLNSVEEIASTRLNMQRPEKYQIVYINVPSEDVAKVTADKVEGAGNRVGSMAENVKKNFLGIFDLGLE